MLHLRQKKSWQVTETVILGSAVGVSMGLMVGYGGLTFVELVRYLVSFLTWGLAIAMGVFCKTYVRKIYPLRKFLARKSVIAPPAGWTLQYHICVAFILVNIGAGSQYALYKDAPLSPFTVVLIPTFIWFGVILYHFDLYYRKDLQYTKSQVVALDDQVRRARVEIARLGGDPAVLETG